MNFFGRGEIKANMRQVKKFYEEILKSFIQKLQNQIRHKPNTLLTEEKLQNLLQKSLEFQKKGLLLFNENILRKQGTTTFKNEPMIIKKQTPIQDKIEIKQQHDGRPQIIETIREEQEEDDFEDDQQLFKDKEDKNIKDIKLDSQKLIEIEMLMEKQKKEKEKESKKQQRQDQRIEEKPIKQQENIQDDSSEDEKNFITIKQCEHNMNAVILGTFLTSGIKRRPKQQKTTIQLQNCFIKSNEAEGEMFYTKLLVQIQKKQRQEINLDNIKKQEF